jgi:L-aminopeptidase/D-esterase-like protein
MSPAPSTGARPGERNLITDVPGLRVGHAQDAGVRTGVTVLLADAPVTAAVDVRGGGPASREIDVLSPENLVQTLDAIVLSGGSVYGLGAADGVTAWLGARGRGYGFARPNTPQSPIVPAACLYDLANEGNKAWGLEPPYRRLGLEAVQTVNAAFDLGGVGAGFGAKAGNLLGGIGSASLVMSDGWRIGGLAAVNSHGSVVVPGGRHFWAAPFEVEGEFGGLGVGAPLPDPEDWGGWRGAAHAATSTTLACVATDVALTRVELKRIAIMANDGMARAIRPAHSPFDGDVVFALSTGRVAVPDDAARPLTVARIGAAAADTLTRAIARGVFHSRASQDRPGTDWASLNA